MTGTTATPARIILRAAEEIAAATEPHGADWAWMQHALMRMLANHVSYQRGLYTPWPLPPGATVPAGALDTTAELLHDIDATDWEMPDVARLYEVLLEHDLVAGRPVRNPNPARRAVGVYYTPPETAVAMCAASLGAGLRQADELNPNAGAAAVLMTMAYDPACGAGIFLTEAARWLATTYATRGGDAQVALPLVISCCCYGVDLDPVAVDLTKTALWWQIDARFPIGWLDRHIIVGNTLAGDEPAAYTDRQRTLGPVS